VRHASARAGANKVSQFLALTLTGRKDIVLHDRDAAGKAVLIAQPFKDPLRGMPLLLVNKPVRLKDLVDNADKWIKLRTGWRLLAAIPRRH